MSKDRKSFFWASYADLMTSLFFVMIVLFILTFIELDHIGISREEAATLRRELDSLRLHSQTLAGEISTKGDSIADLQAKIFASQSELNKVREIEIATSKLDARYFEYSKLHKKHKLKLSVKFGYKSSVIPVSYHEDLKEVGRIIKTFIDERVKSNLKIQYLLIVEGQSSRDSYSKNYQLSYERSLALVQFWEKQGIVFDKNKCEVLICGSGDGKIPGTDLMREIDEANNQRFLIHIIPKPGIID